MAINYSWRIQRFETHDVGGMTDVVNTIRWRRVAEENGVKVETGGAVDIPPPAPETFVPFDQITRSMARGWLTGALPAGFRNAIDTELARRLEEVAAPQPRRIRTPPWGAN